MNDDNTNDENNESETVTGIDLSKHANENYNRTLGTNGKIASVAVEKPNSAEWFRCADEETFSIHLFIAEAPVKGSFKKKSYLVQGKTEAIHQELLSTLDKTRYCKCVLYQSSTGVNKIWTIKMQEGTGELTEYTTSVMDAHTDAQAGYIKMKWAGGRYEWISPRSPEIFRDPIWPVEQSMLDIMNIAFRDSIINDMDHPVVMDADGRSA